MARITNFFAGANSGEGFQNLFHEMVDLEATYDVMILKGGPGVGKNTFMREIGRTMEQAGTPVYNSKYQQQIDALLDQVAGRGSFNYDVSSDPLYQAYKNQYVQGGRLAMQDTMGQAAALTGGYGSSYASTAGNQAYQQYLGGLNDQLLNLQSNALARYEAEGNRLQNLLGNYQNQESSDYNRYRDQVGDYYDKLNALRQGQSVEYGRYQDALSQYNQDYDRALNQYNQEYLTALEQYLQWSDRYNNI